MGQRSQIIISVPPVFYNKDNPNNKPRRMYVCHNQWLYGTRMIVFAADLVRALLHEFEHGAIDGKFSERHIEESINYANFNQLGNSTHTHIPKWHEGDEYGGLAQAKVTDMKSFVDWLDVNTDNNNGYLLVFVHADFTIDYQFLTGHEDAGKVEAISARDYVAQFGKEYLEAANDSLLDLSNQSKAQEADVVKLIIQSVKERFVEEI